MKALDLLVSACAIYGIPLQELFDPVEQISVNLSIEIDRFFAGFPYRTGRIAQSTCLEIDQVELKLVAILVHSLSVVTELAP